MSNKRATTVGILTAGIAASILATTVGPAAAQGSPVGGSGNGYYLTGAGNPTGQPVYAFAYGNAGDDVFFGHFTSATEDQALVRRGNSFILRGTSDEIFVYGDKGDTILVGDWDGDGLDTLAVKRSNHYFLRNDLKTGYSTTDFLYGDAGDEVLVGNWDGVGADLNGNGVKTDTVGGVNEATATTDTLAVRRGNHFLIKNDLKTGTSEYDFYYGEAGDTILVGDWAKAAVIQTDDKNTPVDESKQYEAATDNTATTDRDESKTVVAPKVKTPAVNGDKADQPAIKRGNHYLFSDEVAVAKDNSAPYATPKNPVTVWDTYFGEASDVAFTATSPATKQYSYQNNSSTAYGTVTTTPVTGDGIGLRRVIG